MTQSPHPKSHCCFLWCGQPLPYVIELDRLSQLKAPRPSRTPLTFRGQRDHFPEAEGGGQTSFLAALGLQLPKGRRADLGGPALALWRFLCEMLQRSKGVAHVTRLHWPRGPGPCPPETLPSHALSSTLLSSYRKNSVYSYDFFGFFCFCFVLVNDSHILQSPSFVF